MNLIITENDDSITDSVIAWTIANGITVKRINNYSDIKFSVNISNEKKSLSFFANQEISKVWHRRARLNLLNLEKVPNKEILSYIKKENDALYKSIEIYLKESSEYVGSWLKETENYKITQLLYAKEIGIDVPDTLVTNNKSELLSFFRKCNQIIVKDIRYPVYINIDSDVLLSKGVKRVMLEDIQTLEDLFSPMLFQKEILKKFEVRVFFFQEKYYAMAIFSQDDEKTKLDYRNYNRENPNRNVPVILPQILIEKLKLLMKKYDLNTGSIDLIFSHENQFVFLEVNPQGQFEWLSKNCNYYIEKDIANFFKNE